MKKRRGAETKTSRRAKAPLRRSSCRRASPAGSPPLLLPADWLLSFTLVPLICHCLWGRPGECSCLQCDPDLCRASRRWNNLLVHGYCQALVAVFLCVDPELHALPSHPTTPFFVTSVPLSPLHPIVEICFFSLSNSYSLLDFVLTFFFLAACVLHVRLWCYSRHWIVAEWHSRVFCLCLHLEVWMKSECCFTTVCDCLRCRSVSLWQVAAYKLFSRRFCSKIFNQQSDEVKCDYLPWQLLTASHHKVVICLFWQKGSKTVRPCHVITDCGLAFLGRSGNCRFLRVFYLAPCFIFPILTSITASQEVHYVCKVIMCQIYVQSKSGAAWKGSYIWGWMVTKRHTNDSKRIAFCA